MTVAGGPIYQVAERAAAGLSDRSIYVSAVLNPDTPAPPGATDGGGG